MMRTTDPARPRIICHMVMSIDGRLLPDRWTPPPAGIDADLLHRHYDEVAGRFSADGWMVGRVTMAEFARGSSGDHPVLCEGADSEQRATHVADRNGRAVAVALDPQGKLHYGADHVRGDHVVAVIGERVSETYLAELRRDGVSYVFAGADGHDLHRAMNALRSAFGLGTLLLEGGGRINGAFLKAGLIDELSVLVYPGIDGLADAPSIFESVGSGDERPAGGYALRHLATETLDGGMVWLRYRVEADPRAPTSR